MDLETILIWVAYFLQTLAFVWAGFVLGMFFGYLMTITI